MEICSQLGTIDCALYIQVSSTVASKPDTNYCHDQLVHKLHLGVSI